MFKINYKNERFINTGTSLLNTLDKLSKLLFKQLNTKGMYCRVNEMLNDNFNDFWGKTRIQPNNYDNKHSKNEYCGIYAFSIQRGNKTFVKYIGISKTIRRRFRMHTSRNSMESSSWTYLMLKDYYKIKKGQIITRKKKKVDFIRKKEIYPCRFTFITIPPKKSMFLHLAEAFCVNKLHSKYNSFETH